MSKKKKNKQEWSYRSPPPDPNYPSTYRDTWHGKPPTYIDPRASPGYIPIGREVCRYPFREDLVGIPQGSDGNLLIVGGVGSGKSRNIIKPTLETWNGTFVALDIKGELYSHYQKLYQAGLVKRRPILFDPYRSDGVSYDPLCAIDPKSDDMVQDMWNIVTALIPTECNEYKFWTGSEQDILMVALLYYQNLGLNFVEIMKKVAGTPTEDLIKDIDADKSDAIKMFKGDLAQLDIKHRVEFGTGIRVNISHFAADPYFEKSFCGDNSFWWDSLEQFNIFIRIPEDKIEHWDGLTRLMFTQLFRYLMRRPDKYSPEGANNTQTLLLLDEFARFGKINMFTEVLATLRSKSVNICISLQSLAQLDKYYGVYDRRIICDNCRYKVILSVSDVETQEYFSKLIGTSRKSYTSYSSTEDDNGDIVSSTEHTSYVREPVIYPHEFGTLSDVLFLSPYGFHCLEKNIPKSDAEIEFESNSKIIMIPSIAVEAVADLTPEQLAKTAGMVIEMIDNPTTKNHGNAAGIVVEVADDTAEVTEGVTVIPVDLSPFM